MQRTGATARSAEFRRDSPGYQVRWIGGRSIRSMVMTMVVLVSSVTFQSNVAVADSGGAVAGVPRLNMAALDWDTTTPVARLAALTTGNTNTILVASGSGWAAALSGATPSAIGQDIYGSTVPTTGTTTLARAVTYTSFGTPIGTNTFEPRLGYRGELALDNQLYLRARNYQSSTGQFTTVDPIGGIPGAPTLNNRYHYTTNSPLHHTDPLGLYGVSDASLHGTGMAGFAGALLLERGLEAAAETATGVVVDTVITGASGIAPGFASTVGVVGVSFGATLVTADIYTKIFISLYETSKIQRQLEIRLSDENVNAELAQHTKIWHNPDGSIMDPQPSVGADRDGGAKPPIVTTALCSDDGAATNTFEPSPKHDQTRPGVGAQPTNGQSALARSVQVSDTSSRRVGVDAGSDEIVVFDETYPGQCIFHGHVRTWDELTQKMQSALYKAGLTDLRGRIL